MAFKKGDKAELPPHSVKGEIVAKRYNETDDNFQYLLEYSEDGETHQRWFNESDLSLSA